MATFELQAPAERMRFFNTKDYPSLRTIAYAVQGQQTPPLNMEQNFAVTQYKQALAANNYNLIEKNKFFPLTQKVVDTEASLRKLEDKMLFRSMGPMYETSPYPQPRVFGGNVPLPPGQWYPDPQSQNPTLGKILDLY